MRYQRILLAVVVSTALTHGCGGGGSDGGQPTPTPAPAPANVAFVIATDFNTGSFATVDLDPPRSVTAASPERRVHTDAVVRVFEGRVYVVNRGGGDNIQVLDPTDDFATLTQCSTGNGSDPHDIAFVDATKAYVTLYAETELLIVNPSVAANCDGFVHGRIDLEQFADADGIPEMDLMAIVGDRLYVTLQRLDRNNFFTPVALGLVVVIDTSTDTIIDAIELGARNPFSVTKGLWVDGSDLLVSMTGNFGEADGGIQRVDTVGGELEPFVITEEELGGDLTDFVIVSDTVGYAVISKPDFSNALVQFNPSTATLTREVLPNSSTPVGFLADIELNDRGELYVSDRTSTNPGVRILRASDGTELTAEPLAVGLPPAEIVFLE